MIVDEKEIMKIERKLIFETVTKLSDVLSECEFTEEDIPAIIKTLEILMKSFFIPKRKINPDNGLAFEVSEMNKTLKKLLEENKIKNGK